MNLPRNSSAPLHTPHALAATSMDLLWRPYSCRHHDCVQRYLYGWWIWYEWHVSTRTTGYARIARSAHFLNTDPCGGLAQRSSNHAAAWHISCRSVASSFSAVSSTLVLSSMRAWYSDTPLLRVTLR